MRQWSRFPLFAAVLAVTGVACVFIWGPVVVSRRSRGSPAPRPVNADFSRIYGAGDVRILQFYTPQATIVEGARTQVCYSVLNAKSVRIDPPLGYAYPAVNHCLEAAPARDTRYTLTAEGADGRTVSESFVVGVRPDEAALPRITSFVVARRERDYAGKWIFSLRFTAVNVGEVSIDPPVFPVLHGSPYGSFYVAPQRTTTYTLTVTATGGHKVQRQLTVTVPPAGP